MNDFTKVNYKDVYEQNKVRVIFGFDQFYEFTNDYFMHSTADFFNFYIDFNYYSVVNLSDSTVEVVEVVYNLPCTMSHDKTHQNIVNTDTIKHFKIY